MQVLAGRTRTGWAAATGVASKMFRRFDDERALDRPGRVVNVGVSE